MYIYMYARTYVCVYVLANTYKQSYAHHSERKLLSYSGWSSNANTYVYEYMHMFIYLYIRMHVYICMYVDTCACADIETVYVV